MSKHLSTTYPTWGTSWIEAALKERKRDAPIIAYKRASDLENVTDLARYFRNEGIKGISPDSMKIAERFDSIGVKSWEEWPTERKGDSAHNFDNVVERFLESDLPATIDYFPAKKQEEIRAFWQRIHAIRIDDVDVAREMSRPHGGGIRFTDLYLAGAKRIKKDESVVFDTVGDYLEWLESVDISPQTIDDYRRAYKMICELYQIAFSNHIEVGCNFVSQDSDTALINPTLAVAQNRLEELDEFPFEVECKLPALKVLKNMGGDYFMRVWENGQEYRTAFCKWADNPHDESAKGELCENLITYTEKMFDLAGTHILSVPFVGRFPINPSTLPEKFTKGISILLCDSVSSRILPPLPPPLDTPVKTVRKAVIEPVIGSLIEPLIFFGVISVERLIEKSAIRKAVPKAVRFGKDPLSEKPSVRLNDITFGRSPKHGGGD